MCGATHIYIGELKIPNRFAGYDFVFNLFYSSFNLILI